MKTLIYDICYYSNCGNMYELFCNLKHNALIWLDGDNLIACDFSSPFLITFLLFAVHVSNTFPPFVFDNKYCTYISISNSSLKHSQKQCPVPTINSNIWYLFIRQVLYILSSGSFYNFDSSFMKSKFYGRIHIVLLHYLWIWI